jgi:hypothetical protein
MGQMETVWGRVVCVGRWYLVPGTVPGTTYISAHIWGEYLSPVPGTIVHGPHPDLMVCDFVTLCYLLVYGYDVRDSSRVPGSLANGVETSVCRCASVCYPLLQYILLLARSISSTIVLDVL